MMMLRSRVLAPVLVWATASLGCSAADAPPSESAADAGGDPSTTDAGPGHVDAGASPVADAAVADAAPVSDSGAARGDGAAAGPSLCSFASGLNVAWVKFANDVPNPDLPTFKTIFQNTHDAGGRIVRWWFHTNGTVTPGYQSNGMVQALPQAHVDGVKSILDAAHAAGVAVVVSLWSFDMLQANAGGTYVQNTALLTKDDVRQSYVDAYLTPLVKALAGHPGLYAYEIFNEPEGMTPSGFATYRVDESAIQKTVNWFAAAIHEADPSALVTNGSQEIQYSSDVDGKTNYYSDTALRNAGGKAKGTLDFYEVHYYASNGASNSVFLQPKSHWALDKKLVVGEFFAAATDGVAQNDTYTSLYDRGYDGAWAWAYESDQPWPSMQTPMQNLFAAQAATVGACATPAVRAGDIEGAPRAAVLDPEQAATFARPGAPGFRDGADAPERASQRIHALATAGRAADARAEAETMVNRHPDSTWVREVERFTGAHRHRSLRVRADGALESY